MTILTPFPTLILIASGHNNTAGYQAFPVAPHYQGLQYPREIYAATSVYDDGKPFAELLFAALDAPDYGTVCTLAGVLSAKVADVTIRLPDRSRLGYSDYNGQAKQPRAKADGNFNVLRYYGVLLLVRQLGAI